MFTKITTKALLKKIDVLRGITRIKNIFVLDVNSLDGLQLTTDRHLILLMHYHFVLFYLKYHAPIFNVMSH